MEFVCVSVRMECVCVYGVCLCVCVYGVCVYGVCLCIECLRVYHQDLETFAECVWVDDDGAIHVVTSEARRRLDAVQTAAGDYFDEVRLIVLDYIIYCRKVSNRKLLVRCSEC